MQVMVHNVAREVTPEEYLTLLAAGAITDVANDNKTGEVKLDWKTLIRPALKPDNGMPQNVRNMEPTARKAMQDYAIDHKRQFSTARALADEMSKMDWPGSDYKYAARTIECVITNPNLRRRQDEIRAGK